MARSLSPQMASDIRASELEIYLAVEMFFSDTNVTRAWSGLGTINIGGNPYTGVGDLGQIGPITETTELKNTGVTIGLSGIPLTAISNALLQDYQGRPCNIYIGTGNAASQTINTPYKIFGGQIDTMQIEETAETATISVKVESRLLEFNRPKETLYTDADQQDRYPGDRFFEYVPSLQEKEILWGRTA